MGPLKGGMRFASEFYQKRPTGDGGLNNTAKGDQQARALGLKICLRLQECHEGGF